MTPLRRLAPVAAVAAVAVLSVVPAVRGPVNWTPDGLFYQARTLTLQGRSEPQALREVFAGPPWRDLRQADAKNPYELRHLGDPFWVNYTVKITRRRVLVPALAAAVYPLFGTWSLQAVSLAGYVAFGLLLYALLRRRFGAATSATVATICLLLPPLRLWSFHPLTDSCGLALEAAGLLAAVGVLDKGLRRLPLWVAAIAALSITRDAAVILVLAAAWLAVRERTRRTFLLAVTGLVAALPAPLVFGSPVRDAARFAIGDFHAGYWPNLHAMVRQDVLKDTIASQQLTAGMVIVAGIALLLLRPSDRRLGYARRIAALACLGYVLLKLLTTAFFFTGFYVPVGLLFFLGVGLLFAPLGGSDSYLRLHRAAAAACACYLALFPNPSGFRLELAFLPLVAVGLARAVARWAAVAPDRDPTLAHPHPLVPVVALEHAAPE